MDPLIPSSPPTEPVPATAAAPPTPPAGRKLPIAAIVVAVVALVGGLVLGAVLFGGDDDDPLATANDSSSTTEADQTTTTDDSGTTATTQPTGVAITPPTTVDSRGLEGDALELADAINKAYGLKYHAAYEGSLDSGGGGTTKVEIEVWRDPSAYARRDTHITGPQGIITRELRRPENIYGCISPDNKEYVCTRGRGTVDPADPVFGAVDPREGVVTEADPISGAAKCFTVSTLEMDHLVCFDDAGIPTVVDTRSGRMTRKSVDRVIATSDFDLPAEPSGDIASTSTTTS